MSARIDRMQTAPEDLLDRLEEIHADGFGWAMACCDRDAESAGEVLQLTYFKIITGKARFDGRSALKTWFFAVIRRTALDQRRRAWFIAARLARWVQSLPQTRSDDPERIARRGEAGRIVEAALATLSRRQREVLHLVFYQDMSLDEAAAVLELSPGTARVHYERGKSRLRDLLPADVRP
jgi:RNA polymerase sigma factor (sigma-70 family)